MPAAAAAHFCLGTDAVRFLQDQMDSSMSDCVLMSNNSHSSSIEGTGSSSRMEGMRMVETWVISEYCNAGNLQDAVMLHNGGVFFDSSVPQMVRCKNRNLCSIGQHKHPRDVDYHAVAVLFGTITLCAGSQNWLPKSGT